METIFGAPERPKPGSGANEAKTSQLTQHKSPVITHEKKLTHPKNDTFILSMNAFSDKIFCYLFILIPLPELLG